MMKRMANRRRLRSGRRFKALIYWCSSLIDFADIGCILNGRKAKNFRTAFFLLVLLHCSLPGFSQSTGTPSSQNVCSGNNITAIHFSGGPQGNSGNGTYWYTVYSWTCLTSPYLTDIGGPYNSSTGDIATFIALNATASPIAVTITVTPIVYRYRYGYFWYYDPQTPFTVSITVYPTPSAPTINPSSVTACSGSTANLTATGAGANEIYRWYTAPSGGTLLYTGATYTVTVTTGTTTYYASIYNTISGCESVRTPVQVTGMASPTITLQPQNSTICENASASFIILAGGTGLTYQWYENGVALTDGGTNPQYSGSTSDILNINSVPISMNGYNYYCMVKNSIGCITNTNTVTLTVTPGPSISAQPQDQTKCVGDPAQFSVTAIGSGFQWKMSATGVNPWIDVPTGGVYSGETTSTLTIATPNTTSPPNTYYFRVVVSIPGCGSVTSSSARLRVRPVPTFSLQPQNTTVCYPDEALFTVANGSYVVTWQWQESTDNGVTWHDLIEGSPYSNVTSTGLRIHPTAPGMDQYQYRCVATSTATGNCSLTSDPAILTIHSKPTITIQPVSLVICNGGTATFTVTATGTLPLTYQWYHNGNPISGANSSTFTINPVGIGDVGNYYVIIRNSCGSATSNTVTLSLPADLAGGINTNPVTACLGYSLSQPLSVNNPAPSGGILPYWYQWYLNSTLIPGENSSTYDPGTFNVAGVYSYHCVISDACGTELTTGDKVITIVDDPSASLTGTITCLGSNPVLTVTITGGVVTDTYTYVWYSGPSSTGPWTEITGENNPSYSPPTGTPGSTWYYVVATPTGAGCDAAISPPVEVTVLPLPFTSAIWHY